MYKPPEFEYPIKYNFDDTESGKPNLTQEDILAYEEHKEAKQQERYQNKLRTGELVKPDPRTPSITTVDQAVYVEDMTPERREELENPKLSEPEGEARLIQVLSAIHAEASGEVTGISQLSHELYELIGTNPIIGIDVRNPYEVHVPSQDFNNELILQIEDLKTFLLGAGRLLEATSKFNRKSKIYTHVGLNMLIADMSPADFRQPEQYLQKRLEEVENAKELKGNRYFLLENGNRVTEENTVAEPGLESFTELRYTVTDKTEKTETLPSVRYGISTDANTGEKTATIYAVQEPELELPAELNLAFVSQKKIGIGYVNLELAWWKMSLELIQQDLRELRETDPLAFQSLMPQIQDHALEDVNVLARALPKLRQSFYENLERQNTDSKPKQEARFVNVVETIESARQKNIEMKKIKKYWYQTKATRNELLGTSLDEYNQEDEDFGKSSNMQVYVLEKALERFKERGIHKVKMQLYTPFREEEKFANIAQIAQPYGRLLNPKANMAEGQQLAEYIQQQKIALAVNTANHTRDTQIDQEPGTEDSYLIMELEKNTDKQANWKRKLLGTLRNRFQKKTRR